jgi:hypothetical protein
MEKLSEIEVEYFEKIWHGDAQGFSASMLADEYNYLQVMRLNLDMHRITPARVIGTGYKGNTRRMAEEYLDEGIEATREALATRGRSNLCNISNVALHLSRAAAA